MLQLETLPASLTGLLWALRCCFTARTFGTFCALAAGLIAQPGQRTVCGMLLGAGLSTLWHHSRAHWFFAGARWNPEQLGLALLVLIVDRLVPAGAPLLIAVDDTVFRRTGRKVHAAGWHHDGAAKGPKKTKVSWGNCWVVAGIVVTLPFLHRPVCLPVAARLWRTNGPTKQVIAGCLVTAIAQRCVDRDIHVVADAWYAGADGAAGAARGATRDRGGFPARVSLTSRLRANAALYAIAAPIPGRAGRPRRRGAKLGTPTDLAAAADWVLTTVHRYGHTAQVCIAEVTCLWYGVYRCRPVRVILVRDQAAATTGVDLALITTDLTSPAEQVVERYAARWSIEVAVEDAKQITGVGQARNRTATAVHRTVPFGLFTQSLVVLWYALTGHHPDIVNDRRRAAPWYRSKTQPAYLDMIVQLRRVLIAARFRAGQARQPTPEETLAVHAAWAEAAA